MTACITTTIKAAIQKKSVLKQNDIWNNNRKKKKLSLRKKKKIINKTAGKIRKNKSKRDEYNT